MHPPSDTLKRRVLIVEPRVRGHLLVYVKVIAQRSLAMGDDVTLALAPGASRTQEFLMHLAEISADVEIVESAGVLTPRAMNVLIQETSPDFVIVPHGDELAARLGSPFAPNLLKPTCLLVMRDPRWDSGEALRVRMKSVLKLSLLALASKRARVRLVWLRGPFYESRSKEHFAVDPFIADDSHRSISSKSHALRQLFPGSEDTFWFGVTGAVTRRKNLDVIIDALLELRARELNTAFGLAVVGPIEANVLDTFEAAATRLKVAGICYYPENRLLDNQEMNVVVASVDAVVMAYSTNAPNSTLGKAYVLGTRILSAGSRTFRAHADRLGGVSSELSPNSLCDGMQAVMRQARPMPQPDALSSDAFADSLLRSKGHPRDSSGFSC